MHVCVDGAAYHVERGGAGSPLVVLHGFTGSTVAMRELVVALRRDHDVVAIDLPGHGATFCEGERERYRMERVVGELAEVAGRLGVPHAAWLGYSLGGRVALGVAVRRPSVVAALILIGASPGIADPADRARRIRDDEALANRIERDGIAAFVAAWERLPLFASQHRLPDERQAALRAQRLANDPHGLAQSLRGMGAGAQTPLHERLHEIAVPVLLLAGEDDPAYRRIAAAAAAMIPAGTAVAVPAAGHAAHLEQPEAVATAVEAFLAHALSPATIRGTE